MLINISNNKKEIKTVIEESVISVKYDDGFIFLEIKNSKDNKSSIEKYNIELVDITPIKEEKIYLKKYFNGYGKLISIELFCNESIF